MTHFGRAEKKSSAAVINIGVEKPVRVSATDNDWIEKRKQNTKER